MNLTKYLLLAFITISNISYSAEAGDAKVKCEKNEAEFFVNLGAGHYSDLELKVYVSGKKEGFFCDYIVKNCKPLKIKKESDINYQGAFYIAFHDLRNPENKFFARIDNNDFFGKKFKITFLKSKRRNAIQVYNFLHGKENHLKDKYINIVIENI